MVPFLSLNPERTGRDKAVLSGAVGIFPSPPEPPSNPRAAVIAPRGFCVNLKGPRPTWLDERFIASTLTVQAQERSPRAPKHMWPHHKPSHKHATIDKCIIHNDTKKQRRNEGSEFVAHPTREATSLNTDVSTKLPVNTFLNRNKNKKQTNAP